MKTQLICLWMILLFFSCRKDESVVSLGIDDLYKINRMQKLHLAPVYPGEHTWSMSDASGNDSIIHTGNEYLFIREKPGIYNLKLQINNSEYRGIHELAIEVWEEQIAYSPYISRIYEYRPAPGQFINVLPEYTAGDTEENMRKKAEESIAYGNGQLISLGGFGGYVTFGFDHTIVNVVNKPDFKIEGNALATIAGSSSRGSEPGIVMVSLDRNGNGIPDDEWYELAGSEYNKLETTHHYQISYFKPNPDKMPEYDPRQTIFTDTTYIYWEDNMGNSGYMEKNTYHKQDYYPAWIASDALTFSGTRLADNFVDVNGDGSLYLQKVYEWGYVDNYPNKETDKISFDIEWAVDTYGNPVHLPGIDFVRVYTAVNQQCGWLGETSTELSGAKDLHVDG